MNATVIMSGDNLRADVGEIAMKAMGFVVHPDDYPEAVRLAGVIADAVLGVPAIRRALAMSATDEVKRLTELVMAMHREGWTTWPNTSCGRGGIGGQAMTTTCHQEALEVLVDHAARGGTLKEAADEYAAMWPNVRRLDVLEGRILGPRRAGADGRPR